MASDQVFFIYCDESRITEYQYMVIGGVIINSKALIELRSMIGEYRSNYNMLYEMKWGKISNNKLPHYKALIDLVFELIDLGRLNFRCAIYDASKFDHKKFNAGDAELGFYKMYYEFIFHCFGEDYHRINNRFVVFPDHKPGKYNLSELKSRLNNNMFYKLGNRQSPFGSIEATNSKKSDFIQIVDILIGVVGYHKNKLHKIKGASEAKKEFAQYVAKRVNIKEFGGNFKYKGKRFTVWDFKLQ